MGTKNIRVAKNKLTLGGKEYELDYTMASFAYLSEKYGDIEAVFSVVSANNDMKSFLSMKFLRAISDFLYAGIMRPDVDKIEEGKSFEESDTSGMSSKAILKMLLGLGIGDIKNLNNIINVSINGALPEVPTGAAEGAATN